MKNVLFLALLLPFAASSQTISYTWPNQPCAFLLNCDSGCTACNLPVDESPNFTGTNVAYHNIDICPVPQGNSDNALFTYGWSAMADTAHWVLITGIAYTPVSLDSIIITHRAGPDGPERLRLSYGLGGTAPEEVVGDGFIQQQFTNTVLTDLGPVQGAEGMIFGMFQLRMQAYQGNGGSWDVDAIRIVASPLATNTGIAELTPAGRSNLLRYDLLGRPAVGSGVSIDAGRHLYFQQR